jgi:hypothetical protein
MENKSGSQLTFSTVILSSGAIAGAFLIYNEQFFNTNQYITYSLLALSFFIIFDFIIITIIFYVRNRSIKDALIKLPTIQALLMLIFDCIGAKSKGDCRDYIECMTKEEKIWSNVTMFFVSVPCIFAIILTLSSGFVSHTYKASLSKNTLASEDSSKIHAVKSQIVPFLTPQKTVIEKKDTPSADIAQKMESSEERKNLITLAPSSFTAEEGPKDPREKVLGASDGEIIAVQMPLTIPQKSQDCTAKYSHFCITTSLIERIKFNNAQFLRSMQAGPNDRRATITVFMTHTTQNPASGVGTEFLMEVSVNEIVRGKTDSCSFSIRSDVNDPDFAAFYKIHGFTQKLDVALDLMTKLLSKRSENFMKGSASICEN